MSEFVEVAVETPTVNGMVTRRIRVAVVDW